MNIQDINRAIITGSFTNEQLTSIIDAVKYARSQLGRNTMRQLRRGVMVRFNGRSGQPITGTVEEVKLKSVIVTTAAGRYRVPANMLEVV